MLNCYNVSMAFCVIIAWRSQFRSGDNLTVAETNQQQTAAQNGVGERGKISLFWDSKPRILKNGSHKN